MFSDVDQPAGRGFFLVRSVSAYSRGQMPSGLVTSEACTSTIGRPGYMPVRWLCSWYFTLFVKSCASAFLRNVMPAKTASP